MKVSNDELDKSTPPVFGSRHDSFLTKAMLLDEVAPPAYWRRTIALVVTTLFMFIVWAAFAKLDVVATTVGQIMPIDAVKLIQHVDGGRIAAIEVIDGQEVKKGQLLARLNRVEANAEYQTLSAKYWTLHARVERLRALLGNKKANFSSIPIQYSEIVKEQELTLKISKDQISQLESEIGLLSEISSIRSELAEEKLATRVQALDAKRNLSQARAELLRYRRQNLDELNTATSELAQTEEQISKVLDRLERMEVVSPIDGVIHDLKFRTIGGVVPPGATLMSVVPTDEKLHAEVRVQPIDIGFVKLGNLVRIKITTFDFMRYGTLTGVVTMVSSHSTLDEKQNPHFKVIVSMPQNYLVDKDHAITPGMIVHGDIITDRQTVLGYLLRPIYLALSQGMRER
jgi:multidrug efflux pump subunit AcrA (membrane-fusion protein)